MTNEEKKEQITKFIMTKYNLDVSVYQAITETVLQAFKYKNQEFRKEKNIDEVMKKFNLNKLIALDVLHLDYIEAEALCRNILSEAYDKMTKVNIDGLEAEYKNGILSLKYILENAEF